MTALVSAPPGRPTLRIAARASGRVLLGVRYYELTRSRRNVIADASSRPDKDVDEDAEASPGVTRLGTEPAAIAVEALAALTLGGTPAEHRTVAAMDAAGSPVKLPAGVGRRSAGLSWSGRPSRVLETT